MPADLVDNRAARQLAATAALAVVLRAARSRLAGRLAKAIQDCQKTGGFLAVLAAALAAIAVSAVPAATPPGTQAGLLERLRSLVLAVLAAGLPCGAMAVMAQTAISMRLPCLYPITALEAAALEVRPQTTRVERAATARLATVSCNGKHDPTTSR